MPHGTPTDGSGIPATGSPPTPEALEWPLIGRDGELEQIAALRRSGTSPGVVVGAAAGVGKSSLARHAVAAAKADGCHTAWVQATRSAAAVPLGAFAALMPDDRVAGSTLDVMRGMADRLRERAGGRPIVLGVDDAQLLDGTSAALVLHLVLTSAAFVIVTVRTGEPSPTRSARCGRTPGVARLELEPLGEPETSRLVETVLARPWSAPRGAGCTRAAGATRSTCASCSSAPSPRARSRTARASGGWRAGRCRARPWSTSSARGSPSSARTRRARWSCSPSASRCAWAS